MDAPTTRKMNPPARVLNVQWFLQSLEGKFKFPITLNRVAILSCIYYDSLSGADIGRLTGLTQSQASLYLREMAEGGLVTAPKSQQELYRITGLGQNLVSFVAGAAKGDYIYEPPKVEEAKRIRTPKAKCTGACEVLPVPCDDKPEAHGTPSHSWSGGAGESPKICVASLEVPSMVP